MRKFRSLPALRQLFLWCFALGGLAPVTTLHAQFGIIDGGDAAPPQIVRQTHFASTAPKALRVAPLAAAALAPATAGAALYAGTYAGAYSTTRGANYATVTVRYDDSGQLVDLFATGGRGGFGRPASSGSVDANGKMTFTTDIDMTQGLRVHEHAVWQGTVSGLLATGTISLSYSNGQTATGSFHFRKGFDALPENDAALYGDPVDTATGAFTVRQSFLRQNCPAGLEFAFEYSSALRSSGPLSSGWSHNFEMRLDVLNSGQTLVFNWNQNRRNFFARSGTGNTYTCADRAMRYDTLTLNPDGTYTLLRYNQSKMQFNADGQLVQLLNSHGQAINLTYDSTGANLLLVREAISGKTLSLAYDSSGRVTSVTDTLGRKVVFAYNATTDTMSYWELFDSANAGALANSFAYDSVGRITLVQDGNGVIFVRNTYGADGRIATQDDALTGTPLTRFSYSDTVNPPGVVTTATDRNGFPVVYTYDAQYQLRSLRNQDGQTTSHTFDGNGNLLSTTDPLGRQTTFTYDPKGNLLTTTDPTGAITTLVYDGSNNITTIRNALGKQTVFSFDTKNNLLKATDSTGKTISTSYDANGLVTLRTSARNGVTAYTYAAGLPATVKDPNNNVSKMIYDAAGHLLTITDPLGKVQTFTYDANDQPLTSRNQLGNTTSYTYDAVGRKLTEVDPLGKATSFTYDGNGNILSRTDALGYKTVFTYDNEGRLLTTTDPRGGVTTIKYDLAGRVIAVTNPTGQTQTSAYDAAGNQTDLVDALGNKMHRTFDVRNLVTSVLDPIGRFNRTSYDALRRLKTSTNPLGQVTQFTYDDLDRPAATTDPLNQTSTQGFDADGNRIALTNPRGAATALSYDLGGRLTSTSVPGPHVTTYTYDARNLTATVIEPSGQKTILTRDDAGRLKELSDATGIIDYTYDACGRLLTVKQGTSTITRVYNDLGRLTQFTDASGQVLKYAYDGAGNLTILTYPDGKMVHYAYDAANRLTSVADWANRITKYTYDGDGRLATTTRPNGTIETRSWRPTGELLAVSDVKGAAILSSIGYSYDLAGRVIVEDVNPAPPAYLPASFSATYDAANRQLSFNTSPLSIDADGNATTAPNPSGNGSGAYTYDSRNRLIGYNATSYTYDAEDRRTSWKDATGTTTLTTNPNTALTQVLVRTAPAGTVTRSVYGLGLLYEETGAGVRYFHYDQRGSAVAFTDANGAVTGRVSYGPYGEIYGRINDTNTPFLFGARDGVMTDPDGLYYLRTRYYHPATRRFLSQDSTLGNISAGAGLNRFAYANGDPIGLVDPLGLCATDANDDWSLERLEEALDKAHEGAEGFFSLIENEEFTLDVFERLFGSLAFKSGRFDFLSEDIRLNKNGQFTGIVASKFSREWFERLEGISNNRFVKGLGYVGLGQDTYGLYKVRNLDTVSSEAASITGLFGAPGKALEFSFTAGKYLGEGIVTGFDYGARKYLDYAYGKGAGDVAVDQFWLDVGNSKSWQWLERNAL